MVAREKVEMPGKRKYGSIMKHVLPLASFRRFWIPFLQPNRPGRSDSLEAVKTVREYDARWSLNHA